jgi:modulator of FtsH protease
MQPEVQYNRQATTIPQPGETAAWAAHKVLRNTYLLLGLSMIPTIIGAFIGITLNFALLAQHPFASTLGLLAVMMGMFWAIGKNRDNAMGVVLLLAFTLFMGVILGPILQVALHFRNGAQLVGMAAGGTGVIFFTLAGIASVSRKDFTFLGKFLMVGLVVLIIAMLANAFFQIPALSLALSAVAIMIFSGFILYDIGRIIQGGETNYIMATLAIYMDIYNIFVNLLNILMSLLGDRD